MRTHTSHLDDLFASARSENPVVSGQEIDALLDAYDLHGRQNVPLDGTSGISTTTGTAAGGSLTGLDDVATRPELQNREPKQRRILMGSLALLLVGSLFGTGVLLWNGGAADATSTNPTTSSTTESNSATFEQPTLQKNDIARLMTPSIVPLETVLPQSLQPTLNQQSPTPVRKISNPTVNPVISRNEHTQGKDDKEVDDVSTLDQELQKKVEDYWVAKINEYKRIIDKSLSPSDRAELDRLRVRWGVLEDEEQTGVFTSFAANHDMNGGSFGMDWGTTKQNADGSPRAKAKINITTNENTYIESNSVQTSSQSDDKTTRTVNRNVNITTLDMKDGNLDPLVIDSIINVMAAANGIEADSEGGKEVVKFIITADDDTDLEELNHLQNFDPDADGNFLMSMKDIDIDPSKFGGEWLSGMLKMVIASDESESSQIFKSTWDLAARNRSNLSGLKERILNDIHEFTRMISKDVIAYAEANGEEIPEEMRQALTDGSLEFDKMMGSEATQFLGPLYDVIAEPMILLYNGSDINGLISSAIAEPVAGLKLNASTTLKQSYPNPAKNSATIEYELQEASPKTTLRLFSANGGEVRTTELGAQSSGNHSTVINVADLPSGTYLYHLTVQTANGEQVFSKRMEVVH